jgi:hypothetical protein
LSWEGGSVDPVEPVTGVSVGEFLAQIEKLVALEEHPPRMRRPPKEARERAVIAIR